MSEREQWKYIEYTLLAAATIPTLIVLRAFFSTQYVSGWDMEPQYHLVELMASFLREGHITGYDRAWFAGYPAFTFYGPFTYILAAAPTVLTGGLISVSAGFHTIIIVLPFLFLATLRYSTRIFFGDTAATISLLFGSFFLLSPSNNLSGPFGIHGSLTHGTINGFVGTVLILLLLGLVEKSRREQSSLSVALSTAVLAVLILTHTLSTIFAFGLLFTYSIVHGREGAKPSLVVASLALLLTLPWWIGFVSNLEFTSGRLLSILWDDPLISLLPGSQFMLECVRDFSAATLLRLPVPALLLAVCTLTAIIVLVRKQQYALPSIFVVLLLILPRNVLPQFVDLPIHYYRFVMPLFGIMLLLASYGLTFLLEELQQLRSSLPRTCLSTILSLLIAWSLVIIFIQDYSPPITTKGPYAPIFRAAQDACAHHRFPASPVPISETKAYSAGYKIIEFLKGQPINGRVASEMPHYNNDLLGSPHFFSSLIPKEVGVEVIPGLLAESSYSAGFFPATLGYHSDSIKWGRDRLSIYFHEHNPFVSLEGIIHRLRLWSIEYVIATSVQYKDALRRLDADLAEQVFEAAPFAVFRLKSPAPKIRAVRAKPYLFVNLGGISFREFSEEWYKSDSSIHIPVITTDKDYQQLSAVEREQIGGFILSVRGSARRRKTEISPWMRPGKSLMVIGKVSDFQGEPNFWIASSSQEAGIVMYETDSHFQLGAYSFESDLFDGLSRFLSAPQSTLDSIKPVEAAAISNTKITFDYSGPVIVNYSYFPRWKSKNPDQTVFQAAPSVMYVVSRGRTELVYD